MKKYITRFGVLIVLYVFVYAIYFYLYSKRVGAFGCFDDCFNIVAGYFIGHGKILYSQIFFNHQLLMPYISYLIQSLTNPPSLYHLILYHRITVLFFSFIFGLLLVFRYKLTGLSFVIIYELSKYYLFGERFLAESFVVYPLVYMTAITWDKATGRKINDFDVYLSLIFSWFVIFSRESFIPLAVGQLIYILWGYRFFKRLLVLFLLVCFATLLTQSLGGYFFNIFLINRDTVLSLEIKTNAIFSFGLFKIFGYPIFLLANSKLDHFGLLLHIFSAIFIFLFFFLFLRLKKKRILLFTLVFLGFANIRFIEPGTVYYEAFHMTVWYGMFILIILMMTREAYYFKKSLAVVMTLIIVITFSIFLSNPGSLFREKVDRPEEFVTNYGTYLANGESIKILSDKDDTLFVDGWDELLYWQSGLVSPYKYSWYTSFMPYFKIYTDARIDMFRNNPPDFYYGDCKDKNGASGVLPNFKKNYYKRIFFAGRPTCLHVSRKKIKEISNIQWESIKRFEYYLPEDKKM